MNYRDIATADMRLVLLRILAAAPGYEANSSVLVIALDEFGHRSSRDAVHTQLAWLSEQGLVETRTATTVVIAVLTGRGLEVAEGRAFVPGVKRPSPGSE